MAFDRLGIDYESVGISEIDKYAIQSYAAIHTDFHEYRDKLLSNVSKSELKGNKLKTQLDKKASEYAKNFGSICDIKGVDLPQIDVFTWSFPCTDLSKAGKQSGLQGGTRSGLVYEVLRIMQECKVNGNLPKVLIMENVIDLVQSKFIREFQEIQLELEQIGYTNYTHKLNAKDYGVAQNRDRVFMVSILGDYYYEFPKQIKLEKRLKDYLEDNVDEKYYLSEQFIKCMTQENTGAIDRKSQFMRSFEQTVDERIASCITTRETNVATSNFILMPEDTKQGYAKAYEGDRVYINRPHQKRGVVQDGMIQTLKTSCADVGVVVKNKQLKETLDKYEEIKDGSFVDVYNRTINENLHGTITTRISASNHSFIYDKKENIRIRKLTPLECWRLMGIDDDDFNKASQVCSRSQLYRQAGNGIVVDVFASLLSTMKG